MIRPATIRDREDVATILHYVADTIGDKARTLFGVTDEDGKAAELLTDEEREALDVIARSLQIVGLRLEAFAHRVEEAERPAAE